MEEGSGGMPTAFAATWGSGSPVLGSYAEYDAVPGKSQRWCHTSRRARAAPWTAGHTDPHSSLGNRGSRRHLRGEGDDGAFGLARHSSELFGEPAEKMCGSKPVHAAKGYYDGCDAYIAYHPHTAKHGAG